jgi:2-oxoglutarate ferredoxin oxidoreductase subunit gamma
MRKEIRIAGFGGQGIVLAGKILGEAGVHAGYRAVQTQSYGPESRGGAARSEIVIADGTVDYPRVIDADVLVVLSQPGFGKYFSDTKKNGHIIIDTDLVEAKDKEKDKRLIKVPFTKTADKLGKKIVANIVMIGYLTAFLELAPKKVMKDTIMDNIPKGTEKLNSKAYEKGYELGLKAKKSKKGSTKKGRRK